MKYSLIVYTIFFFIFLGYYTSNTYKKTLKEYTFNGLNEAYLCAKDKGFKYLRVTPYINQPYIFYLYNYKVDPNYYVNNVVIKDKNVKYQIVLRVDNVTFDNILYLEQNNNTVYILRSDEVNNYNTYGFKIKKFDNFVVLYE